MSNLGPLHYLATPIKSDYPAIVHRRFEKNLMAVETLRKAGIWVYSPMLHHYEIKKLHNWPLDWEFWKERSLRMVDKCEGGIIVLMLGGWDESTGVRAEIEHAQANGYPVQYMVACDNPNLRNSP